MRTGLVIVALNLIALIILAVSMPHLMISPGKTIDAHAELATDCFACHSPFTGSTAANCIKCHKVDEIGLKTTKGVSIRREKKNVAFHQKLLEDNCVACHSEHKGVQAFRPIGQFSHQLLDTSTQEQCNSCHANPDDSLHRRIRGNCKQCHSQDAWKPATFKHEKYFRFDRDHDTDCTNCHINSDYTRYTCYGCHEHSRSKIREEHIKEGLHEHQDCVDCHRSGDEDEVKQIWRTNNISEKCIRCHKPEQIGLKTTKGLAITSKSKLLPFHQQLAENDCVSCHNDFRSQQPFQGESRFAHHLLKTGLQEKCKGCHRPPTDNLHRNLSGNCSHCHRTQAWKPATFDHDKYFRFDRHHDSECSSCHINDDYSQYTCYGCHEHSRSKIREEHLEEGIRDFANCVKCHRSGDEHEAERTWRSMRGGGEYGDDGDRHRRKRKSRDDD